MVGYMALSAPYRTIFQPHGIVTLGMVERGIMDALYMRRGVRLAVAASWLPCKNT